MPRAWLNRNVAGMTLASFFSDAGHEMVTAVLPGFLRTIGVAAAALGWIEGISDATSSFVKLGAGWYTDRVGHRKGIVSFGYLLTGSAMALFAAAVSWPLVLIGRLIGWFGRGIRSPLRNAMLAESVPVEARGRAFGLHRAGDTVGAVVGPLLGVWLLGFLPSHNPAAPFRIIFLLSVIPGLAAMISFIAFVRENRRPENRSLRLWSAIRNLPRSYARFLLGAGVFGLGDYSPSLLILGATVLLTPAYGPIRSSQFAALLYVVRNIVYAGISFPVGFLSDRTSKQKLLALGYLIAALTSALMGVLMSHKTVGIPWLALTFGLAGIYVGFQDSLEGAIPAELVESNLRGTAYGVDGTVNGVGDLVASALVGSLWTAVSPAIAFETSAALMLLGSILIAWNSSHSPA